MPLPALPLLIAAAAGLAAGWAGSSWLGRRRGAERTADEDAIGGGRPGRPVRTLAWCPVCHAHMAAGHLCRGGGDAPPESGAAVFNGQGAAGPP